MTAPAAALPLFHEDLEAAPPPAWSRFRSNLRGAEALLFVTPEYNRSIPALLKNAIDVGSSPEDASVWAQKPGAIVSFSPGSLGGFGANHHLRQCMVFLDVPLLAQPEMYLSRVDRLFDDAGALADDASRTFLTDFMAAFAAWLAPQRHLRSNHSDEMTRPQPLAQSCGAVRGHAVHDAGGRHEKRGGSR